MRARYYRSPRSKLKANWDIFQIFPPLYPDMKVKEYIDFSARLHKVPNTEVSSRVKETVDKPVVIPYFLVRTICQKLKIPSMNW